MQTTLRVKAHQDDVNAVTFADDSPNVIVSGSDDALIKVCRLPHTVASTALRVFLHLHVIGMSGIILAPTS